MSRDEERARKFAVKWSTRPSQEGEIANLAGCYLRASKERRDIEIELLDAILRACGRLVSDECVDVTGQLYGISSAREIMAAMLKVRREGSEP